MPTHGISTLDQIIRVSRVTVNPGCEASLRGIPVSQIPRPLARALACTLRHCGIERNCGASAWQTRSDLAARVRSGTGEVSEEVSALHPPATAISAVADQQGSAEQSRCGE